MHVTTHTGIPSDAVSFSEDTFLLLYNKSSVAFALFYKSMKRSIHDHSGQFNYFSL